MRWACILFPQLALDDVLRRRADRDAPLVLIDPAQSRPLVRAVNRRAGAAGVKVGQSLAAARALCDRLTVADHDVMVEIISGPEAAPLTWSGKIQAEPRRLHVVTFERDTGFNVQ